MCLCIFNIPSSPLETLGSHHGSTIAPPTTATSETQNQRSATTTIFSFIVRAICESCHHHGTPMFFIHENVNHLQQSQTLNRVSSPKSQNHFCRNDKFLHAAATYTSCHHQRQISIHTPTTQQNDVHFASPKSHFAKPEHE